MKNRKIEKKKCKRIKILIKEMTTTRFMIILLISLKGLKCTHKNGMNLLKIKFNLALKDLTNTLIPKMP